MWGYEQTNIDFYQVVEVKSNKTIKIRQVKSKLLEERASYMSSYVTPLKDEFKENAKLLTKRAVNNIVRLSGFERASLWDGKPMRASWYA